MLHCNLKLDCDCAFGETTVWLLEAARAFLSTALQHLLLPCCSDVYELIFAFLYFSSPYSRTNCMKHIVLIWVSVCTPDKICLQLNIIIISCFCPHAVRLLNSTSTLHHESTVFFN